MSFKKFSTTHNAPIKGNRAGEAELAGEIKSSPLVDQPPAPPEKTPADPKPNRKS